jgi:hypothetical protein
MKIEVKKGPSSALRAPSPILRTGEGENLDSAIRWNGEGSKFDPFACSRSEWEKVPEGRMRALWLNTHRTKI